jgi:deoxycytidylate deaminase
MANSDPGAKRCPCLTCSIKLIQVGISEVVYSKSYMMDQAVSIAILRAEVSPRLTSHRVLPCLRKQE